MINVIGCPLPIAFIIHQLLQLQNANWVLTTVLSIYDVHSHYFMLMGKKITLLSLNTLSSSNFQVNFMLNACTNRVTKFSWSYFGITLFGHLETYIFWAFYKEVVFGYKYALPSYLKCAKQSEKYRIRNRLA